MAFASQTDGAEEEARLEVEVVEEQDRGEARDEGGDDDADGREVMRGDLAEAVEDAGAAEVLGRALADDFLARGAARLVAG